MVNIVNISTLLSHILISLGITFLYHIVFHFESILSTLLLLPLGGAFLIAWIPSEKKLLLKTIGLITTSVTFLLFFSLKEELK